MTGDPLQRGSATLKPRIASSPQFPPTRRHDQDRHDQDRRQPTLVLVLVLVLVVVVVLVLVHGAFADASGYRGLITGLEADGFTVVAPPNPLRAIASDAASIRTRVAAIDGPVVLVSHSYAGAVISHAVDGLDNVIGLVYLAGSGSNGSSTAH
ncbi:alpha/beta fold hydrolase [Amycolatopsis mongoliensis]|uniref:alpha/beta fold hydrolase n=1 Tax=Amycolatopsis mongoliensis TaxID=715475 RepID=UPI002FCD5F3C